MITLEFDNGDEMPVLGLGTWKSEPGEVHAAVKEAVGLGYRHIDCAAIYGNEPEIGQTLSECVKEGTASRDELWITSKLWNDCHASDDVLPALEKTLADLQLDYLDLYLVHWPVSLKKGSAFPESGDDFISLETIPIAETWQAMEQLVDKGLVRHLGVSNFSVTKLRALYEDARLKPEMNQIELHPYLQQPEMFDFCGQYGVPLTAYSPLGSMDRPPEMIGENEPSLLEDPTIAAVAEWHEVTPAQVLISWAIYRGSSVIPKSVNPARLKENLAAADVVLNQDDMDQIEKLDRGFRYVTGDFWTMEGSPYTLANIWDA